MLPTDYIELIKYFPPTIVSKHQLKQAHSIIDTLLDCENPTQGQQDYLYLLALAVEDYEYRNILIPDIHGVELLKVLIEERGLKQKDLVPIFRTESIVSAVLNGNRQLTVKHIAELAKFFNVSPAVFFALTLTVLKAR